MQNIIIMAILVIVLGLAVFYIYKAKKNGQKCIGCPHKCSSQEKKCCSCESNSDNT